jgi:hypothetical protein
MRPACGSLYDGADGISKQEPSVDCGDPRLTKIHWTFNCAKYSPSDSLIGKSEPLAMNRHNAFSQWMSKQQGSERCDEYRRLGLKCVCYMIDSA